MAKMNLMVAICTWNRSTLLRQTLEAMKLLSTPRDTSWELLVVDNNSTDDTETVIRQFQARLPLRSVFEPRAGLSNARNRAIRECSGEYVLFTDDDVLVSAEWLLAFRAAVARFPEGTAFGGPIEPWWSTEPDPVMAAAFPALARGFCGLDHQQPLGPLGESQLIWGANMAFRTAAIEGLVFNPDLGATPSGRSVGGEEGQFICGLRRRGGSVIWIPEMRVRHYVAPERMSREYLLGFYTAKGRDEVVLNGIPPGPKLLGVPRWLIRQWLQGRLRSLKGHLLGDRLEELCGARDASVCWGMASACRRVARPKSSDR